MHRSPAVVLGCTDCHGGNPQVRGDPALAHNDPAYVAARDNAHVLPRYPESWHWPISANPRRSYALLNVESPEYVRFNNPSDYRAVRDLLRRLPHRDHRGGGALDHVDRRDAVGRRCLQ